MTGNYQMWLNYNSDKNKLLFPVLPEEVKVAVKDKPVSISLEDVGEVLHKTKRDAVTISFSGYFPAVYGSYCAVTESQFVKAKACHEAILERIDLDEPCHFVLIAPTMPVNIYVVITGYTFSEEGGDPGTIQYSLELQEFRQVTVRMIKNPNTKATVSSGTTRKNTSKKSTSGTGSKNKKSNTKKYTIKSGDCLWNIARKYYGSGSQYTKILKANKSVLDSAAKKYGYSNCRNGNLIFPGTVITIPA